LDRGIEDTGAIDPESNDEVYVIANPGEGLPQTFNIVNNGDVYAGSSGKYTLPKPRRQYDGVELAFDKRLSNRWAFHGSYLLSRAIQVVTNHNYPLYYLGRGSDGRTPSYSRTDLLLTHEFKLPTGRRFQINANVLNLFDQRAVTNKFNNMRRAGPALNLNETAF